MSSRFPTTPGYGRARTAVTVVFLVHGLYTAIWVPQIPVVKARLGLDEAGLSLALLMIAIGALVGMPLTGWLVGRYGTRSITLLGTALMGLGFMLPVLMPSYLTLVAGLMFAGLSMGMMDVAMNANGVEVEQRYGRPILSSLHGFFSVGALAGSLALAAILRADVGLPVVVITSMVSCIALGVLASLYLLTSPRPPTVKSTSTAIDRHSPRRRWWQGLTVPLLLLGGIGTLAYLIEGAVVDWGGVFSLGPLGADLADAGLAYAGFSAAMAIMRLIGDRLQRWISRQTLLIAGSAVAAVSCLAFALSPTLPFSIAAAFVMGFGLANVVPIVFAIAGQQPDRPPGEGIAAVAALAYAGFLGGPPLIGWLASQTDLRIAFVAIAALALGMTLLSVFAVRRHR